jgi:hypothetical protein
MEFPVVTGAGREKVMGEANKHWASPRLVRVNYVPEFFLKNNCFLLKKGISCHQGKRGSTQENAGLLLRTR